MGADALDFALCAPLAIEPVRFFDHVINVGDKWRLVRSRPIITGRVAEADLLELKVVFCLRHRKHMAAIAVETAGQISQACDDCLFYFFGSFHCILVPAYNRNYETSIESSQSHVGEHW